MHIPDQLHRLPVEVVSHSFFPNMLPTGEIEGVDPGKESECDQKCTFLAGFGHFFSKKALPAGEIWMFFRGLGDGLVKKSQKPKRSSHPSSD